MSVNLRMLGTACGLELPDVNVTGMTLDSRAVQAGDVFLALPGLATDGRQFIGAAVAAGAAVVLAEAPCTQPVPDEVVLVPVPQLAARVGQLADQFYGQPSAAMRVWGVTGTNGKTTVAWLLASVLRELGERCGYSGTLGSGEPPALADTGMTSVDVVRLHAWLAQLRASGCTAAALEVSSHALDQGRVDGVGFAAAIFTNLSRDHLDYHGNMASYGAAKARLFARPQLQRAVLNVDDTFGAQLAAQLALPGAGSAVSVLTTAVDNPAADVRATGIHASDTGTTFEVNSPWGRQQVELPLRGLFNVHNTLAVIAVLAAAGRPLSAIAAALARCATVPGRMQPFRAPGRPLVVVDYAHTPDALRRALQAMREVPQPPLVCVFGCGGDRDRGKRSEMGAIAETLADVVVLTDDNPRSEDPAAIVADIRAGMHAPQQTLTVHDRRRAIRTAISRAGAAGSVLVAGKGHERTQVYADRRLTFCDLDVVAQLMQEAA